MLTQLGPTQQKLLTVLGDGSFSLETAKAAERAGLNVPATRRGLERLRAAGLVSSKREKVARAPNSRRHSRTLWWVTQTRKATN